MDIKNLTLFHLKEFFAGFLRHRGISRHFRRLALLESLTRTGVSREMPPSLAQELAAAAKSEPAALLERLGTHADGLTEHQADEVRERVGPNEVEHEKPLPWWAYLWQCYTNPFNLLLTVLAAVSYLTEDLKATIVIASMVALSTLLRFWQESKSNRAADQLKAMVSTTATVLRRDISEEAAPIFERYYGVHLHVRAARRIELPIRELVPGDVVVLAAGDMIPADCRLLTAKGAVLLSRQKVIVKRLDAIQNFGAMNVLCTDKTGTLTQDRIFLARHTDIWGEESDAVLELAYLNSYYQTGLKNLLDVAVLEHLDIHQELNPAHNYRKVDEIPFDFQRRRMSVVVSERDDHHELICKGAVEEVLQVCTRVRHGEVDEPLAPDLLARLREITAELNDEGLRVVAVAATEVPPAKEVYGVADERNLTLIGYVAFLDPPKETTAPALAALARHGVLVKVLTGDNERVTAKICREVDMDVGEILLGSDIEEMSDAELGQAAETHTVFARLTPTHKERIVRALRANGQVVGFMGDGINDAPALRAADIGISVDTAVDIAKEAADIILLEKSLMVLEQGVLEGRRTFANMLKYIKMTASSNFGNVFSVLVASAFLPFLPMLPMQLLVQNLLYDISQIAIPFDYVDPEQIERPQRWNPADLGRFMLYFGPISSIFDIATFALMWFVFSANTPADQTLFQSGWFIEGLLTQTLIVHMIRTVKIPILQSRAAAPLTAMTGAIMACGIFLPMGPIAHYFKMQALPLSYFVFLAAILLGYIMLTQAMKGYYARRFGWQ